MNIYGLDFTSAPSRKKPITCAVCELTQSVGAGVDVVRSEDLCGRPRTPTLKLIAFLKLSSFAEFEDFLRWDGPWLAALDFPFGQPRRLISDLGWPETWEGYVGMIASMGKQSFEHALLDYCAGRPAGEKLALRRTDVYARARSPMMLFRVPVAKMFFQGATRLLASGVSVLPCRPTNDDRMVVEGYPALVARRCIGSSSYKSDERARQTADQAAARGRILEGVHSSGRPQGPAPLHTTTLAPTFRLAPQFRASDEFCYGCKVELSEAQVESFVADGTGDCLDALLCAVQAAWAYSRREDGYGIPRDCHSVEGWIVDPAMRDGVALPR